eukprot:3432522-Prorocentrum_lima.AAC.1
MRDRGGIELPPVMDLFRDCPYLLPRPAMVIPKLAPPPPPPPPPELEPSSGPGGPAAGPGL